MKRTKPCLLFLLFLVLENTLMETNKKKRIVSNKMHFEMYIVLRLMDTLNQSCNLGGACLKLAGQLRCCESNQPRRGVFSPVFIQRSRVLSNFGGVLGDPASLNNRYIDIAEVTESGIKPPKKIKTQTMSFELQFKRTVLCKLSTNSKFHK